MKKKLIALCLIVVLAAVAVVGGTLAYFTDTDAQTNVFTTGDVKIDLWEDFDDNDGNAKLIPGKKIEKEAYITNDGSEAAYVRVHIAIPSALLDANFNSWNNMLHMNFTGVSAGGKENTDGDDYWNWMPTGMKSTSGYRGWQGNGLENFNYYKTTIGEVEHFVYVVTYMDALQPGATTAYPAISAVYLDEYTKSVKNADGSFTLTKPIFKNSDRTGETGEYLTYTVSANGNGLVKIVAEATQVETFADAYTALNTAFGDPAKGYVADWTTAAEGRTWLDTEYTGN